MQPIFSICHPTARPTQWRKTYDQFMTAAATPERVEYVLCFEDGWGFDKNHPPEVGAHTTVLWSEGRKGVIPAMNQCAKVATGKVILLTCDDFVAPQNWDQLLMDFIPNLDVDFVVKTAHRPGAAPDAIIFFQILSRARYARLGYALWPEYLSVYADTEFTEHAMKDGVVLTAPHILFRHAHPLFKEGEWDEVYDHGNRSEAYEIGKQIYERRRAEGFPSLEKR